MKREQTRAVRVGGLQIGGQERVVIQSMCNTPTKDAEATIAQIQRLQEAGCELVRMSVMDMADAQALARIKAAVSVPLVADIQPRQHRAQGERRGGRRGLPQPACPHPHRHQRRVAGKGHS